MVIALEAWIAQVACWPMVIPGVGIVVEGSRAVDTPRAPVEVESMCGKDLGVSSKLPFKMVETLL